MVSIKAAFMKSVPLVFFICLITMMSAEAQSLRIAADKSSIGFAIKNFGVTVDGSFTGLSGTIIFDPGNISGAKFSASVDAKTVNTGISSRDNHLRKKDYFNVDEHAKLRFESTQVSKSTKDGVYVMQGNLTIKGIAKPVRFGFTATPVNGGYLFKGKFNINRRDFTVGGNSISLSDELQVILDVTATN